MGAVGRRFMLGLGGMVKVGRANIITKLYE
jgi:hypothetical protein